MPDPFSIPFRQAEGNGHYQSKELPDDKQDFLTQLGVPSVFGDVLTGETSTVSGQLTVWYGTDGHTIKAVPTTTSGIVVAQSGVGTFEPHPAGAIVGTDAVQTLTNKTFGTGITFGAGVTFTGGVTGLTKTDVGLGNVDNTSDNAKNSATATLTNKTISLPLINSPTFSGTVTGLTKASVGLGNVDNTSDLNKPISSATQSALDGKENLSRYNVANGYAPLGADSKVPLSNLPDAVLGGSRYQGTWNATTNIPPIPPAVPTNNGWYYVVSQAGNTNIDGINVWALGDTAISNGAYWQKIPNTNAVVSVNAKTGAVVINKTDVGLGNVDNTSDATKNSAVATLTNKTINGASNTLTVRLDADVANNLPVSRLNGGTGASAATYWRGDGLWVSPTGAGDVQGPGSAVDGEVTLFSGTTGKVLRTFGGAAGFAKVGPGTALTTTPTIGALDVNASLIHGQTQKTSITALDEFLLWDSVASALKSVRYSTVAQLPSNYLTGFTISNAADTVNDITITAGKCKDSTDAVDIVLGSALTKQLDAAWAAGTNAGGRDTGAISDAWWHVFVIMNPTTGVVDALLSLSLTSPTLPSGFTFKRRIGTIQRWVAQFSGIRQMKQVGDYFEWVNSLYDVSGVVLTTGANTFGVLSVPPAMKLRANAGYSVSHSAGAVNVIIRDPDTLSNIVSATVPSTPGVATSGSVVLVTNTSAQVLLYVSSGTAGNTTFNVGTLGYWDYRGKQGADLY
jgi:hypothetical protein